MIQRLHNQNYGLYINNVLIEIYKYYDFSIDDFSIDNFVIDIYYGKHQFDLQDSYLLNINLTF